MSKNKNRKATEATEFLGKPSEEGQEHSDVSEGEGKTDQASEAVSQSASESEPKQEKKLAMKAKEQMGSEVPGKYRKFH